MTDREAFKKLESLLVSCKVPRALWPRYFEREKERRLRLRRWRDEDEYRRALARHLEQEHGERKRRQAFSMFIILLLWLVAEQQRQQQSARDFARRAVCALAGSEHVRYAGADAIHRGAACVLVAGGFGKQAAADVLSELPGGMQLARRMLENATDAQPTPLPATEPAVVEQEQQLTDDDATLAAPTW